MTRKDLQIDLFYLLKLIKKLSSKFLSSIKSGLSLLLFSICHPCLFPGLLRDPLSCGGFLLSCLGGGFLLSCLVVQEGGGRSGGGGGGHCKASVAALLSLLSSLSSLLSAMGRA